MNKEADNYLQAVRLSFPMFLSDERQFLEYIRTNVNAFVNEFPECTKEELEEEFGEPKDIVLEYYGNMDSDTYFKFVKQVHTIRHIALALILVLFMAFIASLTVLTVHVNDFQGKNTPRHLDTAIQIEENADQHQ